MTGIPFDRIVNFYSKARSLREVSRHLKTASVLPMVIFTVEEWKADRKGLIKQVLAELGESQPWIVRSSSLSEDALHLSNAGHYVSVLDVTTVKDLELAIDEVIRSYGTTQRLEDELLVQPMARGLIASGVATTRDITSGLPYRIINLSKLQPSDTVTAGRDLCASGVYLFPHRPLVSHAYSNVFDLIDELSGLTANAPLDIEFGIAAEGLLLFQLRRLAGATGTQTEQINDLVHQELKFAVNAAAALKERSVTGRLALGVMPDWNPAEMIGLKPRPLSYDLYAHLITSHAWTLGRRPFGYRDMSGVSLMHCIAGTPYIDIEASVSSLLPSILSEQVVESVVSETIERLRVEPQLHDKIELCIVPTCLTPEMMQTGRLPGLPNLDGTDQRAVIASLGPLTCRLLDQRGIFSHALYEVRLHHREVLALNRTRGVERNLSSLLITARKEMAPRFSTIARVAFACTAIIRGLQQVDAVRDNFFDLFVRSIRTISQEIQRDVRRLPRELFLERYGHVRPGTYDIRNLSYADGACNYFESDLENRGSSEEITHAPPIPFVLTSAEKRRVDLILGEMGLRMDSTEFLSFSRDALVGREYAKDVYSGFVSHSLDALAMVGQAKGFDLEDLSFIRVAEAQCLLRSEARYDAALRNIIDERRVVWRATSSIRVPYLMFDPNQLFGFDEFRSQPSFITRNTTIGPTVRIGGAKRVSASDCRGAIILMEAADPGHDWIFSAGIIGLVTAFGGENSHMSIRSREFNIAAVIGVGGQQFAALCNAAVLRLSCAERAIEVIH